MTLDFLPSRIHPFFGGPYMWFVQGGHYSLRKATKQFVEEHKEMYRA